MLDRNRIKSIDDQAFASQWNLQELHIEENRIKDLGGLMHLENLQRLYLGMNRIQVRLLGLHSMTLQRLKYTKDRTPRWSLFGDIRYVLYYHFYIDTEWWYNCVALFILAG